MFARLALAAALSSFCAAASAATLSEADAPGGAFSGLWSAPTVVGSGYDVVQGVGAGNQFDNFVFTLPAGAQRITFNFTAPAGADYSYSAGGQILTSESPFRYAWDGAYASGVQVDYYNQTQSYALDVAPSFGGTLYLALNFTHGANLAYNISVPSNANVSPAPVPLPAGIWLIGSAVAALGGVGALRRRKAPAAAAA